MKVEFFITVTSSGSIRTTKNRPNLNWDEITIGTSLEVPDQLFKRPQISASIEVPPESVSYDPITAEIADNIKESIEAHAGLPVKITIENNENQ